MPRRYTKEQHSFINDQYKGRRVIELRDLFNKEFGTDISSTAIKSYLTNHKLRTGVPKGGLIKFTSEIIEFIRQNVSIYTDKQIAELINNKWMFNINEQSVTNIKVKKGIKTGFGRGQFVRGQQSWNKGMKLQTIGRMAETQFKKGDFSPNRLPVGTERINRDGYHEVKIQDGSQNKNWVLKHRLIWEQHNGSIPTKHRIVFLDGNKNNLDINNLALMTYGQTAVMSKRNLFFKEPELTKLGSIIAEIEITANSKRRNANGK